MTIFRVFFFFFGGGGGGVLFFTFFIFLLKTYIVGTRLNRLSEAVLMSTNNLCFGAKIRTKMYTPVIHNFTI